VRAHYRAPVQDINGGLLAGTVVTLYSPGTNTPLPVPIYADGTTGTLLPNPFVSTDGNISFYLDGSQRLDLGVQPPGLPQAIFSDIDVELPVITPTTLTFAGVGANSVQLGVGAAASNTNATAAGEASAASGVADTAVGQGATASGGSALAAGQAAAAAGFQSSAVGATASTTAPATQGTAVGYGAQASAADATALGAGAQASAPSATAVGAGAVSSVANQMVLGTVSTTVVIPGVLSGGGGAGNALIPTGIKTSGYSAIAGDFVPVDVSGGSVTVALPNAPADKAQVGVKLVKAGGSNTVSINASGSDKFNDDLSVTLTLKLLNQGVVVQYMSSGGIWYVLGDDLPLGQLDARYLQPANNLSDLGTPATARTNLGLGTAAVAAIDTTAGDIAALGTQAAGAVGKVADAGHVHPTTGVALLAGATFTGAEAPAVSALTDAATIVVNAALGNVFTVTLGGNRTLGNPSNPVDGQKIVVVVKQDGSGSRTLAYGTSYAFSTSLPSPTLSTAPGATDYLGFIYSAVATKWRLLAFISGF